MAEEKYIDKIEKNGEEYDIHASNGGTKLYKHEMTVITASNDTWEFEIITLDGTPYSNNNPLINEHFIKGTGHINDWSVGFQAIFVMRYTTGINIYGYESEDSATIKDLTLVVSSLTDTVTEL